MLNIFAKHSTLDVWQGSGEGIKRDTHKCLIYAKTDYSIHSKLTSLPLFWSNTWKYKTRANGRLTKIKEKWSTIQFDVSDLSFIIFIPMCQTISVINRSGMCFFYAHQTSGACAGMCTCDRMHQMEEDCSISM